ncbi:MAG: sulfatase [Bryobacteraceae bacterium]|nr:sulfatase [Bryobacteraceae bacterium]
MLTRRSLLGAASLLKAAPRRPNVLLLTADDLNYDSLDILGGIAKNLTPNLDRLAAQGMRFERAHVTVAVCQPSRSTLMTGRYPIHHGAEGFSPIRDGVPTLTGVLREAGYFNGIFSKTVHLAPIPRFCWDVLHKQDDLGRGREPAKYAAAAKSFFAAAKTAGKPFFLMANSDDPHRPFAGSEQERQQYGRTTDFTRLVKPEEVTIPGFLPDLPDVRRELAQYATSVHRCDQTIGAILQELEASGEAANTLVMFLSDNGMALPFAKTNCYLQSTHTPWMVRWPGRVKPGQVERKHFISGIDFTPTVLDALGLPPLAGVDGRSFLPLLAGKKQLGREHVFTYFHETSAHRRFEMRAVQDGRHGYIWNPWVDGKIRFKNESQAGLSWKAMAADGLSGRADFYELRTPEELYDYVADPHGKQNLIQSEPAVRARLRGVLRQHLQETQDPMLAQFTGP